MRTFLLICFSVSYTILFALQDVNWQKAQKYSEDSLKAYISGQRFYPNWIKDSHCFYYNINKGNKTCYYLFNAKNGKKKLMIKDNDRFIEEYGKITGDTLDKQDLKIYGFQFEKNDFDRFYLRKNKKSMLYDISEGKLIEIPYVEKKSSPRPYIKSSFHSKDSAFTMLGSEYNLFIRDNKSGKVKQITFDGKEGASYTNRETKDTVENNSRGFWVGHKYVYLMRDEHKVKEMSLIHSLTNPRPTTNTFRMPMPGDSCVWQYRIFWYNADKEVGKMLPIEKYPDQLVVMDYFRSDTTLYITRRSRKADKIDLCKINLEDGSVTELISEENLPHLNLTLFNYKIINNGKNFIWWSERTGRGNYYLYNEHGKLQNRITNGENLVAGRIQYIDTVKNEIIFVGYGNEKDINPYYTFYYKVSLDGKKQVLLTPGNGNHELSFSDDKKYAIDTYSRMDMPHVVNSVSIENPTKNFLVEKTSDEQLRKAGWRPPILLKMKAADGLTDLYGMMYVPSHLNETKKYPIISNVYPGPQDDQISHSFLLDDNGNQSLAELGFVVINFASRGSSPVRGSSFYCFGYGNLRDYPLADDKSIIEQLAAKYSFIDLKRVGIYGHSGGGFQSAAAILSYPDFYKVAIAASGNHDNNIYIQWWGEIFHGLDEKIDSKTGKTTFSIKIPTNMELAGNLKGRLMLITGDQDKNVPPSSTYRLADALIKANKRFDMFIFPGKDHGLDGAYYKNLIHYYFVENLLGIPQNHIDIVNHK